MKNRAKSVRRSLIKYEELPDYLKDNEYIRSYYRCEWPLKNVFLSIFSLHNETLNIWTHLVGLTIFVGMLVRCMTENASPLSLSNGNDGLLISKMINLTNSSPDLFMDSIIPGSTSLDSVPIWPLLVFLYGAICCLGCSSISHLLACHSKPYYYLFSCLDYAGIAIMIVCSMFTPIYYVFSEHQYWRFFYLGTITLIGILVVIILFTPDLSSGRFRALRATIFLSMGFSGLIPAIHAMFLYWDQPQVLVSVAYEILMGVLYAIGAGFYVSRIPERWKSGAFDIVGQSHQIFHILIVAAALVHSVACRHIIQWRRGISV